MIKIEVLNPVEHIYKTFSWGHIDEIHIIGDIQIVEYTSKCDKKSEFRFHVYVKGEDVCQDFNSLDAAILGALGYKYDGVNSQFARFSTKMLGI